MTKLDLATAASAVCISSWDDIGKGGVEAARATSATAALAWREAVFEEGHLIGNRFVLGDLIIPIDITMLPFSGYKADEAGVRRWLAHQTSYHWATKQSG